MPVSFVHSYVNKDCWHFCKFIHTYLLIRKCFMIVDRQLNWLQTWHLDSNVFLLIPYLVTLKVCGWIFQPQIKKLSCTKVELHSVSLSGISLHNFSSLFLQVRVRALSSNLTCVLGYKAFKQMNQSEAVCSYAMIQTHSKSDVKYSVITLSSSLNHDKATCSKACLEHNCKIIVSGRVSDLLTGPHLWHEAPMVSSWAKS